MRCEDCDSYFRTIHLKKGQKLHCYHCGHDNGIKQTPRGEA